MNDVTQQARSRTLPAEVRALAKRLGAQEAGAGSQVLLTQAGTLRKGLDDKPMAFVARQWIGLDAVAFDWRARIGPLRLITVIDALIHDAPRLEVRVLGGLRLSGAPAGVSLLKGQVMRYLAELPWAPDAILRNFNLHWCINGSAIHVTAPCGEGRAGVELTLDDQGWIASVSGDRPRIERQAIVERPWRGRFFDYRWHQDRWLPFQGEAAWVLDGLTVPVWHGSIGTWKIR